MSDHEFEKKMQQKMDELRLRPSEAVWTEVEKNLRRDKRRRRVLLWLPLMGILLTAGGYFVYTGTKGTREGSSLAKKQAAEKSVAPAFSNASPSVPASPSSSNASSQKNATPYNTSTPSNTNSQAVRSKDVDAAPSVAGQYNVVAKAKGNSEKIKSNNSHKEPLLTRNNQKQPRAQTSTDKPIVAPFDKNQPAENNKIDPAPKNAVSNKPIDKDSAKTQVDSNAIVNNTITPDSTANDIAFIDSSKKKDQQVIAKAPIKKKKLSSKFQWGVTAGGGVANISAGSVFDMLNAVRVDDFTNAGAQYNGFPPTPAPQPSPIRSGPMFSIGGFVQTNLSKRITLSVGLQYDYWTVNTKVGRKIDSIVAVNTGFQSALLANTIYRADMQLRDYTNRYHFISLPVMAGFQLTRSKKMPLVFDAGFSLARLMNTNALHFDGINRVYYENDDFFNKLQVSLNTGINIGLLQNSKHPVWVGPNLRYATTGLLKKELTSDAIQHLWSFGVNAKMLLKK